jgi:hypothetical protein
MFRKRDGKLFGVLNDFDLALLNANGTKTSKNRTGTRPFMAIDLLGSPDDMHRYRHDLESLFYVIIYVITRYHDGREIDNPPLQDWNEEGEQRLKRTKHSFLYRALPHATQHFTMTEIEDWAEAMRRAFKDGYDARETYRTDQHRAARRGGPLPEFDEETLGGYVSFETIGDIFRLPIGDTAATLV